MNTLQRTFELTKIDIIHIKNPVIQEKLTELRNAPIRLEAYAAEWNEADWKSDWNADWKGDWRGDWKADSPSPYR